MTTRLLPKTALAAAAAVGLFLPFGAPLPGSCLRTIGVAGAAPTPSPSCGSDLRECLRASADLRQTTFGGRYVTADDVARCMEAFRSCVSGGASRGGNASPPKSTAAGSDGRRGLPERLTIKGEGFSIDCTTSGETMTCTDRPVARPDWIDEYTRTYSGKLSDLTMTGTAKAQWNSHVPEAPSCVSDVTGSGPVTYAFNLDGTVVIRVGPIKNQGKWSGGGNCSDGPFTSTEPFVEITGNWSEVR